MMWTSLLCCCFCLISASFAFQPSIVGKQSLWTLNSPRPNYCNGRAGKTTTCLHEMKRPILDRLATFVFKLENDRVANSSVEDDKGRSGEPMEWAEEDSFANKLSDVIQSNDIGYKFKQTVADLVAGEYDRDAREESIRTFIGESPVAMYSFTTCPFCRKAKDYLEEQSIAYESIELDLLPGNEGNEIRAELGRITRRTSVPSIFIGGEYIGGCNDGPGLLPLARENGGEKLNNLLERAGVARP
mmetsp:Transcript_18797/g.28516  ORF Transcript_18797/g.28516 Transcript_18797/m.28516 type:complete len:244 (+) Transcript_18797:88-819(+)